MNKFLSCDWGTSSFRLRLVNTENITVLAEITGALGIAALHSEWIKTGHQEKDRLSFYEQYLQEQILEMEKKYKTPLAGVSMVLSGMASSSIGMMDIPYKELPYVIGNNELKRQIIAPTDAFPHKMIVVAGLRTEIDVLRGEETMLEGCGLMNAADGRQWEEALYIFPGTHSKHISVKNGTAWNFHTYMTGEFFDLLSAKSILSGSVQKNEWGAQQENDIYFERGVRDAAVSNMLNLAFYVRTNQLLGGVSPTKNYHYLSGLLIGSELKGIHATAHTIVLVCNKALMTQYAKALECLGRSAPTYYVNADDALIRGQAGMLLDNQ